MSRHTALPGPQASLPSAEDREPGPAGYSPVPASSGARASFFAAGFFGSEPQRKRRCSRVLLLPRDTGYQARRYRAQFQLDRSAAERKTAAVTVALPFAAWPGDLVQLTLPGWIVSGRWRVQESQVTLGVRGCATKLTLGVTNAVL